MATQFEIDCALMEGRAYQTTRAQKNWFPVPAGWNEYFHVPNNPDYPQFTGGDGFEAVSFQNKANPNQIVISFAGTASLSDFVHGNTLALGMLPDQLRQAATYYLQVKASAPPGASISFTGHSLGGGLAALMAVMFNESALTFDAAPFRLSALSYSSTDPNTGLVTTRSVAKDLLAYLQGQTNNGQPTYSAAQLSALSSFVSAQENAAPGVIPNEGKVSGINVSGEILSLLPLSRIGAGAQRNLDQQNNMALLSGKNALHSQALLTAFLQSEQAAQANKTLSAATYQFDDLLAMIFDERLFARPVDT